MEQLTIENVFPSLIYKIEKPEFLEIAKSVSYDFLEKRKKEVELDEIYPFYMTEALNQDYRMLDFSNYVAQTAWNILNEQGYKVQNLNTYFSDMWCQEHYKSSSMEQHVHGNGTQIVGFYFLDSPENCSKVVFHDSRAGKVQSSLNENNLNLATPASIAVNYEAKEGTLLFTNAWMPHSFTRHSSEKPMRFIHFNICVKENNNYYAPSNTEII